MTKQYGLSDEQAKSVRSILEEQTRKAGEIAKDASLAPEEKAQRMISIRDEEIKRISDVLTPEQRKKYEAEVRPAALPTGLPAGAPESSAQPSQ